MIIRLDLETYSENDIKLGVYKYAEAAEVLLLAYKLDDMPTEIIDVYHDGIPEWLQEAIINPANIKIAFNAQFERVMLSKHFGIYLKPEGWICSKVAANRSGVIGALGIVAAVIGEAQKDTEGKRLIKYFSIPCKPTKVNGGRTRNLPKHNMDDWELFKSYCMADVEAEASLKTLPMDEKALAEYWLDQKINDMGVRFDITFIENCVKAYEVYREQAMAQLKILTGLENPNSNSQFMEWLNHRLSETSEPVVRSLAKAARAELLEKYPDMEELKLKDSLATSSVAKFTKMLDIIGKNCRGRGLLRHYEAGTGRAAGTLVQPQNLPNAEINETLREEIILWNAPTDIEVVNQLKSGKFVPSDLKGLIRPCLIPSPGYAFAICDFSAIEAVVLAYLAGAKERIAVFEGPGNIYEYSASKMFDIPIETIVEGHENYSYRKKGKIAELALGYQGGKGALAQMGFNGTEYEAQSLVYTWRDNNKDIQAMWYRVQKKVEDAWFLDGSKNFKMKDGNLEITLLSGRKLIYRDFQISDGEMSYNRVKNSKWVRVNTYGGKLVENIVQATARDLLYNALLNLDNAKYRIVLHVHDEIIIEVPVDKAEEELPKIKALMCQMPEWAKKWKIKCSGLISPYYRK